MYATEDGWSDFSSACNSSACKSFARPRWSRPFYIESNSRNINDDRISVIEAAREVGHGKQAVFKVLNRPDIETLKERSADHRGQALAYISLDDVQLLQSEVASRQRSATDDSEFEGDSFGLDCGVFYLIQLEPERDPGPFKVGFATNLKERLRGHKCSAPFAQTVKTWAYKRLCERTAIECVTPNCDELHTEVFRTEDLASGYPLSLAPSGA